MPPELLSLAGIPGRRRRAPRLSVEALECRLAPANVGIEIVNQTSIPGTDLYLYFAAGDVSGSGVSAIPWTIDPSTGVATPDSTATSFTPVAIGQDNSFTVNIDTTQVVNGGRLYFGNSTTLLSVSGGSVSQPSAYADVYFDYVEITMNVNGNTSLTIDNSQVDGVGFPSQVLVTPASAVAGVNEVGIVSNLTRDDLFSGFQTAMQVTINNAQPYLPYADLLQPDSSTGISSDYRILSPQNLIAQELNTTPVIQQNMSFVSQTQVGNTYQTTLTTAAPPGTALPTNGAFNTNQFVVGPGVPAGAQITSVPNFPTGNTIVVTSLLPFDNSLTDTLLAFITPPTSALNEWYGPYINSTTNINGTNAIDEFFTTWTAANPFRVEVTGTDSQPQIYEGFPGFTTQTDINGNTSTYLVFNFTSTTTSDTASFMYPYFTTNSPGGKTYPVANGGVFSNVPAPPAGWSYLTPTSASQMIFGASNVFASGTALDMSLQNMVAAALSRGTATTWQTTWGTSASNVATVGSINGNTLVWNVDTTGLNLQNGMNVISWKNFSFPMTITGFDAASITVETIAGYGGLQAGATDFLTFQNFYQQGQVFNAYSMYFHNPQVFIDGLAYAISYDDNGGFSTTVSVPNVQAATTPSITVTLTPWTESNTDNEEYIDRLYEDLLDRQPDPAGFEYWVDLLDSDGERIQSAFGVVASIEHFDDTLAGIYQKFLNRAPDPTGIAGFRALYLAGERITTIESLILASPEYFALSGGTDTGFIENLYQDVLGRPADPTGLVGYLAQLAAGVSRQDVAKSILNSKEAHGVLVSSWYVTYLRRPADPAGLAAWVAVLDAGAREETVLESILASNEYYNL